METKKKIIKTKLNLPVIIFFLLLWPCSSFVHLAHSGRVTSNEVFTTESLSFFYFFPPLSLKTRLTSRSRGPRLPEGPLGSEQRLAKWNRKRQRHRVQWEGSEKCSAGFDDPRAELHMDGFNPAGNDQAEIWAEKPLSYYFMACAEERAKTKSSCNYEASGGSERKRLYIYVCV